MTLHGKYAKVYKCVVSTHGEKAEYPLSPYGNWASKRSHFSCRLSLWYFYATMRQGTVLMSGIKWIAVLSTFIFLLMEGKTISDLMINEQIRDREIRLIGENGEQLGIVPTRDAMKMAEDAGLDLVKIAPTAKPPVCKIVDYGKYKYEQLRKEKEARKKQKIIEIKEIRLSPNIDTNDLNTKVNAARKFLTKGDKVKVTLRFRGREMAHMNNSRHILDDFAESLSDISVIEKAPKVEGRSMTMFLTEKR